MLVVQCSSLCAVCCLMSVDPGMLVAVLYAVFRFVVVSCVLFA